MVRAAWLGSLVLVGCGLPGIPLNKGAPPCADGPDYACDVQPLLQQHCVGCHTEGGVAPFPLQTFEQVSLVKARVAEMVEQRLMPPWPPDESGDCPPLQGSRRLSDSAVNTLVDWARGEAALGTPGSVPAVITPVTDAHAQSTELGAPDRTYNVGGDYMPNASREDDYRCFVVDPQLNATAYVHAYDVQPSNRQMVHHVLLYMTLPDKVAELEQWDAADPEPGFECFGTPSPGIPLTLGGWVPGQRMHPYRQGDGAWLPAGAKIVVQMHYNLIRGVQRDETAVKLYFVQGPPSREVGTLPFPITDFRIPAGMASYTATQTLGQIPDIFWSDDLALAIEGVAPHMHLLGSNIQVTMEPPAEAPSCLVEVPKWDFHWQGFYLFNTARPLTMPVGSTFRLSCTWDNSPEHQLWVNGAQLPPRNVTWGEGSRDEMCLAYLVISGNPGWVETVISLFNL